MADVINPEIERPDGKFVHDMFGNRIVPDIFFIPNAPGGYWKEKGLALRWLDSTPRNLRLKTLRGHGFPGFRLFGGEGKEATMKVIQELGLNESYYDSTRDRIMLGDLVLGYISLEERERRLHQREEARRERFEAIDDNTMATIESTGFKPRKFEEGEYDDRKKYAQRGPRPMVGYRK